MANNKLRNVACCISNSGKRLFVSLQVYDHPYKAVLDGEETEGMLEIDPGQRIEIFRMGNGSEEVLEVHDFKNVSITAKCEPFFWYCNCALTSIWEGLGCSHPALFKRS